MARKKIVIAIDGYSSCGKSTLAKSLARQLGYIFIDSGAMYRAVTLHAIRKNWISKDNIDKDAIIAGVNDIHITFRFDPEKEKNTTYLYGEDVEEEIRKPLVSELVSPISAIREVREAMVKLQQQMGENKGIVMDGRDIGTVVFPHAELKIFMTADPEIRAQRRYLELKSKGLDVTIENVRHNILQRDRIDQSREESPLKQADDSIVLDNSYLTLQEQLDWAVRKTMETMERL